MKPEFKKAFTEAYSVKVADFEDEEVEAFISNKSDGVPEADLYKNHECYTSVTDALGMFEAGIAFNKAQSKITLDKLAKV